MLHGRTSAGTWEFTALTESAGGINPRVSLDDPSVPKGDDSAGKFRDFVGMRDDDDRDTVRAIEFQENFHDLSARTRIELSGRFVGQKNLRFVDERASDRYALLLSSGKLRRQAVFSSGQTNQSQHALGSSVGIAGVCRSCTASGNCTFSMALMRGSRLKF